MGQATRNITNLKKIKEFQQNIIVILSAGDNPKMRSCGPRSTLQFNNQTILERQQEILIKQYNNTPIIVVHGYRSNTTINRAPAGIINVVNSEWETCGIAKSIAVGLQTMKHTGVLLIYGDLIFNTASVKMLPENKSQLYIDRSTMRNTEVGCVSHDGIVENLTYDISTKWAQITYFTGRELYLLKNIVNNKECDKWNGMEIINHIIERKGVFLVNQPRNIKIYDVDTPQDIKNIKDI